MIKLAKAKSAATLKEALLGCKEQETFAVQEAIKNERANAVEPTVFSSCSDSYQVAVQKAIKVTLTQADFNCEKKL
jgi:hypothetical protein